MGFEAPARRSALRLRRSIEEQLNRLGFGRVGSIPADTTFRQWVEELGERGLKVDGRPFSLADRPALIPVYDAIPTTIEQARDKTLVMQKATQLGLTVWEVLADIYLCKKFAPLRIGLFLPSQALAIDKSSLRFMPILRSAPELYNELTHRISKTGVSKYIGEGNVLSREMGESILMFLWTSGKATTESRPMDVISLDEVQEMALAQIEKVMARCGASDVNFRMLLSTANGPDVDINFWYKRGTQEVFHTHCQACGVYSDLSEPAGIFPNASTAYSKGQFKGAPTGVFVWVCPACQAWIQDAQIGKYICQNPNPDPGVRSLLLPRVIAPKNAVSPNVMVTEFNRAITGDQKKSYYNRTLARPYIDANQLPVTMTHCLACVAEGEKLGLQWETSGAETYMGIDQMGGFNCVIIKRRLPDGRQAVIHCEVIYDEEPFVRCGKLMKQYGVAVCVVEQLPNYNSAHKFANKFRKRVYLTTAYTDSTDPITWGDDLTKSDRRTDEDERNRYTVTVNQYKAMQTSLHRIRERGCLFPNPSLLEQEIQDQNGAFRRSPLVTDMVFLHFTKTALVVTTNEKTGKSRPSVSKVGLDPHFSFANMLCDVAWARNHGTGMMILPEAATGAATTEQGKKAQQSMPGLPANIVAMIDAGSRPGTCGSCFSYLAGVCTERDLRVGAGDVCCDIYAPKEDE